MPRLALEETRCGFRWEACLSVVAVPVGRVLGGAACPAGRREARAAVLHRGHLVRPVVRPVWALSLRLCGGLLARGTEVREIVGRVRGRPLRTFRDRPAVGPESPFLRRSARRSHPHGLRKGSSLELPSANLAEI